jgi:hypothetical protein
LTVIDSVFDGNWASHNGGGVWSVGSATILNSTFYGNGRAVTFNVTTKPPTERGGAIYLGGTGPFQIVDVIFSRNAVGTSTVTGSTSEPNGGAIFSPGVQSTYMITRSLFHENVLCIGSNSTDCSTRTDTAGDAPVTIDSLFDVDPLLADPEYGDFHLLEGSPAIDAGVTQRYARYEKLPLPVTDFEGDKRVVDGDGLAGAAADIGADEYVPTLQELHNLIVGLLDSGQIDEGSANDLLRFVDDAQAALDGGYPDSARFILEEMIDWLKALEDTETRELILRKAEAVHGTFD